ncbi:hypothetical protein LSH36_942g01043 [Paralvinella palmiformis]|uniref:Actin-related protein 6 n=1 Tax=Paralvinella palmiformis TaxID=53620 RepID=A0AAD9IYB2_9ANNE|nr:hypothetical protein LSH36_942g01043 [Paralvinella palmiformis]
MQKHKVKLAHSLKRKALLQEINGLEKKAKVTNKASSSLEDDANGRKKKSVPNCVIKAKTVRNRIFIGDQIEDCKDLSGLYYLLAFQKGYLINWEIERQVWDYIFGKSYLDVDFDDTSIIITEPYFNFPSIQEAVSEILFEDYQFHSVFRCNSGFLTQSKYYNECKNSSELCCLVIDSGYSFTHVTPYYLDKKIKQGIKRINVGGKILTNHLKEIVSYRQLMVMDETYVMNQVKEDVCFVSLDFFKDMEIAKKHSTANTIVRDYVLPDYTHIKRGHIRDPEDAGTKPTGSEQIIRLNNERFSVPEVLFHPSDIGIQEMGLAETVVHSISCTPEEMHPHLYNNIVVTGGNGLLPGFKERLYNDVRAMAPCELDVRVTCSDNPVNYPWQGGVLMSEHSDFNKQLVTKAEYEEYGYNLCMERFDV